MELGRDSSTLRLPGSPGYGGESDRSRAGQRQGTGTVVVGPGRSLQSWRRSQIWGEGKAKQMELEDYSLPKH